MPDRGEWWPSAVTGQSDAVWPAPIDRFARGIDVRAELRGRSEPAYALAGARLAALAFDAADLDGFLAPLASIDLPPVLAAERDGLRVWAAFLGRDLDRADRDAEILAERARAEKLGWLAIEAAIVRSLVALERDDASHALTLARRASRMARSDSVAPQHVMAGICLARARRFAGASHLAGFILAALAPVAPPMLHDWLEWESLLAGIRDPRAVGAGGDAPALASLLVHAAEGDRGGLARARETELRSRARSDELARIGELLDPFDSLADAPPDVLGFCLGVSESVPRGAGGLCAPSWRLDDPAGAWIAMRPGEPGRRFLPIGRKLAPDAQVVVDDTSVPRISAMLAALALEGPRGLDEADLFKKVYGFEYRAQRHAGARRVLYHRARGRLPAGVTLETDGALVRLLVDCASLVLDPRPAPPAHKIVRLLARAGQLSAKDVASTLGVPLRTAQNTLKQLATDGACQAVKSAGAVKYELSDTTYSALTSYASMRDA